MMFIGLIIEIIIPNQYNVYLFLCVELMFQAYSSIAIRFKFS